MIKDLIEGLLMGLLVTAALFGPMLIEVLY